MPDVSPIGNNPTGPLNRTTPGSPAHLNGTTRDRDAHEPIADRVEVSDHARLLDQLRQLPDVRADRVERVRSAIEDGGYETEARLDVAIERLLQDLGSTD